jgi:dienelactone hydrolase
LGSLSKGTKFISDKDYDLLVDELLGFLAAVGVKDTAKLEWSSRETSKENPFQGKDKLQRNYSSKVRLNGLPDLFMEMKNIMEVGGYDAAVMRVFRRENSNDFIVLLPETHTEDGKLIAKNPNDWNTNFLAIKGKGVLVDEYKKALDLELKSSNVSPKDANIMIGGFSQGGLLSGLFASKFSKDYNVEQVIALGSPISKYNIPKTTNVLSLKSENDPVAFLDGKEGVEKQKWDNFETVYCDGGWHGTDDYAKGVESKQCKIEKQHVYNRFLNGSLSMNDYYFVK